MKFTIRDNPQEDGGGYRIVTDEFPVFWQYRVIYASVDSAKRALNYIKSNPFVTKNWHINGISLS